MYSQFSLSQVVSCFEYVGDSVFQQRLTYTWWAYIYSPSVRNDRVSILLCHFIKLYYCIWGFVTLWVGIDLTWCIFLKQLIFSSGLAGSFAKSFFTELKSTFRDLKLAWVRSSSRHRNHYYGFPSFQVSTGWFSQYAEVIENQCLPEW